MLTSGEVYRQAGVDIDSGNRAVDLMHAAVRSTHGPQVLTGPGLFSGAYALDGDTVLVASTDSVGTKLRIAAQLGRHAGIGVDLVNHCVNDILTLGARPLFFLDYFATSSIDPAIVSEVVGGLAAACREAGCALLGGETAELPGMYVPGEYDVAGFVVGSVQRRGLLDGARVRVGDALLALPSSGPHTNGFSLVNQILEVGEGSGSMTEATLLAHDATLGASLADVLLEPHRSYLGPVLPLLEDGLVRALAHITGGGIVENVPRALPQGLSARVETTTWNSPPVFNWIAQKGGVSRAEMYRVFNMGVGLVLVVAAEAADEVLARLPEAWRLGEVVQGGEGVELVAGG